MTASARPQFIKKDLDAIVRAYPSPLRILLRKADISEDCYNTLLRHGSFMRRRRKGDAEIPLAQLLALKSFSILRRHGLSIRVAVRVIEQAWPRILEFMKASEQSAAHRTSIRVCLMSVKGKIEAVPIDEILPAEATQVGSIELDLNSLASTLVRAPEKPC